MGTCPHFLKNYPQKSGDVPTFFTMSYFLGICFLVRRRRSGAFGLPRSVDIVGNGLGYVGYAFGLPPSLGMYYSGPQLLHPRLRRGSHLRCLVPLPSPSARQCPQTTGLWPVYGLFHYGISLSLDIDPRDRSHTLANL